MSNHTPADQAIVQRLAQSGDAADAVVKAWTDPGRDPQWHAAQVAEVRRRMPVLAAALDRLARQ